MRAALNSYLGITLIIDDQHKNMGINERFRDNTKILLFMIEGFTNLWRGK